MSKTKSRPKSAPDGAESLPGVIEIYEAYEATKAAAKKGGTSADWDAYNAACEALREARRYWRLVRLAVYEAAVAASESEA